MNQNSIDPQKDADTDRPAAGTWNDDSAVFGFNRLAIIDIEHSHQPLRWGPEDNPTRYAMTFNGEIYNYLELRAELEQLGHIFRTDSDTEVLLEAHAEWGTAAYDRFNGMFAFAIYEHESGRLVLGRDRLGIKPLYLSWTPRRLRFASSLPALLAAMVLTLRRPAPRAA